MSNIPADNTAVTTTHDQPNLAGTATVPLVRADRSAWQILLAKPVNKACLAVILIYSLIGFVSILPAPRNVPVLRSIPVVNAIPSFDDLISYKYNLKEPYAHPSLTYVDRAGHVRHSVAVWFGLDFQGHSILWEVLYGIRTAMLITVLTSAMVLVIGTVTGLVAGYFGGIIDDVITWIYSVLSTIPWQLLVIAITYVLKQNESMKDPVKLPSGGFAGFISNVFPNDLLIVVLALGVVDWVGLCRLIRGEVIKLRDSDMVAAGRALGLSEIRILFRHILPNVSHLIIITFTLGAVGYLQVEVVLSFLGLGVSSKPSWGKMIDDAKVTLMRGVWWEVVAATAAIFIICTALTLLGDSLRDALDPKLRGRT